MYKNVIFDFDGTISDSRDFSLKTFLKLTKTKIGRKFEHIIETPTQEAIEKLKNISFRDLKKRFKLNILSFFRLIHLVQEEEYNFIISNPKEVVLKEIPFYDGILDIIEELKREGVHVYLLSSNRETVLKALLGLKGKEDIFEKIVGRSRLLGKHTKIRSLMNKYSMKAEETLYIGDEVRDIEASRKVGIDILSVTWGDAGRKLLVKNNPTYICDEVVQLKVVILGK